MISCPGCGQHRSGCMCKPRVPTCDAPTGTHGRDECTNLLPCPLHDTRRMPRPEDMNGAPEAIAHGNCDNDCTFCGPMRSALVSRQQPLASITEIATDLYFECHVTVEPLAGAKLDVLRALAKAADFRVAELVMRNGQMNRDDAFLSARNTSYLQILTKMRELIWLCRAASITVYRYKIENTLLDSREDKDALGLLK